jgi:predicted RNase H-like nuclease (RuvC/YqgF family)
MVEDMIKIVFASIFGGGGLGALALYLIQRKLNKKKEDVQLAVEYQSFYRKEIDQREKDKYELNKKIKEISDQLEQMIKNNNELSKEVKLLRDRCANCINGGN